MKKNALPVPHPTADSFNADRLALALDCISLVRRLAGRMLGHGVVPPPHIQDAIIELRDLLEELSGERAGQLPDPRTARQIRKIDEVLQATPPPPDVYEGKALTGTQKIILGDLVLYLGKAHELLYSLADKTLPVDSTREFLHQSLAGMIVLLADVIEQDLFEPYDLREMIGELTRMLPQPRQAADSKTIAAPAAAGTASDLITDAITKALLQEDEQWKINQSGLLEIREEKPPISRELADALRSDSFEDSAWKEIWVDDSTPGAPIPTAVEAGFSEELQAIHSNEVQGLFVSIAKQFCTPLPTLLANVQTSDLSSEHLEGIYGIVLNIFNSAEQFGYDNLRQDLSPIRKTLERCQCDPEQLTARERLDILSQYETLCAGFPAIFEPLTKVERGLLQKESIIIMEELRAIKGMGTRRITRLFAAGISNLRAFVEARLEDFAAVSSIDRELGERILRAFRPYAVMVIPFVTSETFEAFRRNQKERLRSEVERLRNAHLLYNEESKKPRTQERRVQLRDLHRKREVSMGQIRCALAVLDEFELIDSMRRIRFDKRLELLDRCLVQSDLKVGLVPKPSDTPPATT